MGGVVELLTNCRRAPQTVVGRGRRIKEEGEGRREGKKRGEGSKEGILGRGLGAARGEPRSAISPEI